MQGVTGPLPSATARGKALRREISALGVAASCEAVDLWAASRDCSAGALLWTKARIVPHPPDVVAWPEDVDQVAAVVRLAAQREVPVVPMGGGTGSAGGSIPLRGGIVLDTQRLTRPLEIDLPAGSVQVGAGVSGNRLEELLAHAGATLGHFPASLPAATVGGWLATRSAGLLSSRHGSIADMVLSLEAVDGAGEILRTLEGPSGGPDLAQLLLGNEGTLAIFTSARLRIWRRPRERWVRGVRFPSLRDGLRAVRDVLRAGLRPAIARLHDPLDTLLAGADPLRVPQPLRWLAEGAQAEALRLALRAPLLLNRLVDALPAASLLVLAFDGERADDAAHEGEVALAICDRVRGEHLGPSAGGRRVAARLPSSRARGGHPAAARPEEGIRSPRHPEPGETAPVTVRDDLAAAGATLVEDGEGIRVTPSSVASLARAVAVVRAHRVALRLRGSGDAPVNAPASGVLLDLGSLDRIATVNAATGIARVEAGCSVAALESAVRRAGCTLGPLLP